MLEKQIRGFLQYYKVSGFRPRSLQTLSIRLNDFSKFLKTNRLSRLKPLSIFIYPINYKNRLLIKS